MSNSSGALVVAVLPVLALPPPVPVEPVPVAVWSAGLISINPDTESALTPREPVEAEKVTVMVSLVVSAVVTGAENKRLLTVVPFIATTSWV